MCFLCLFNLIAACRVRRHKRTCGYPCVRNKDCAGSEFCDMRTLQCRNACNPSPCGLNEGIFIHFFFHF